MRRECPWYVSATAVRAWQRIAPRAPRDFDNASDALIEICAAIWHDRYATGEREPKRTRTGALRYEAGNAYDRIVLTVAPSDDRVGGKMAVVDVTPRSTGGRSHS